MSISVGRIVSIATTGLRSAIGMVRARVTSSASEKTRLKHFGIMSAAQLMLMEEEQRTPQYLVILPTREGDETCTQAEAIFIERFFKYPYWSHDGQLRDQAAAVVLEHAAVQRYREMMK